MAADFGLLTILIIFDLSSAFAIIFHTTLLNRLSLIGISHLTPFFLGCTHSPVVLWCVPGLYPGTLFTTYLLPLGNIYNKFSIQSHCSTDDTQLKQSG